MARALSLRAWAERPEQNESTPIIAENQITPGTVINRDGDL